MPRNTWDESWSDDVPEDWQNYATQDGLDVSTLPFRGSSPQLDTRLPSQSQLGAYSQLQSYHDAGGPTQHGYDQGTTTQFQTSNTQHINEQSQGLQVQAQYGAWGQPQSDYQNAQGISTDEAPVYNQEQHIAQASSLDQFPATLASLPHAETRDDSGSENEGTVVQAARSRAPSRRVGCPIYMKNPDQAPVSSACWNTGFPNVSRLKQHLKRNHGLNLPTHERGRTETDRFALVWKELFPDHVDEIPSPYDWDREAVQRKQNLLLVEEYEKFVLERVREASMPHAWVLHLENIFTSFRGEKHQMLPPLQDQSSQRDRPAFNVGTAATTSILYDS